MTLKNINPSTLPSVDIERFMGPWRVQGNIPTAIEKNAYNAVESYSLNPDGSIKTVFTFNKRSFDGPKKEYHPKGFVVPDSGNAVWGMRFIWPIKAEYIIAYVDADYSETIIARTKRDYVWIMTRDAEISPERYAALLERVRGLGYDMSKVQRVPQRRP